MVSIAFSRKVGSNVYPPFQFYLWAVAISPVVLANRLGVLSLGSEAAALAMYLLIRGVTVLMGVGVIFATYLSEAEAFDRRSGIFASLIVAVTLPFVFYAKTANTDVPDLFWMTWSLWFFVRLWWKGQTLDYVMFGATAALAVCTKDHAYGFYTLLPLALIGRLAAQQPEGSFIQRLVRSIFDRRLWIGGVASAVVFAVAHNVLFNWTGMVDHFRLITRLIAPGAPTVHRPWQFDLDLVSMSVELIRWSFRWPVFILCVAGLALALVSLQKPCDDAVDLVTVSFLLHHLPSIHGLRLRSVPDRGLHSIGDSRRPTRRDASGTSAFRAVASVRPGGGVCLFASRRSVHRPDDDRRWAVFCRSVAAQSCTPRCPGGLVWTRDVTCLASTTWTRCTWNFSRKASSQTAPSISSSTPKYWEIRNGRASPGETSGSSPRYGGMAGPCPFAVVGGPPLRPGFHEWPR